MTAPPLSSLFSPFPRPKDLRCLRKTPQGRQWYQIKVEGKLFPTFFINKIWFIINKTPHPLKCLMILACRNFCQLTLIKWMCARGQSVAQLPEQAGVTLDIPSLHQYAKLHSWALPQSSSLFVLLCKLFMQFWAPQKRYRKAREFPPRAEWNAK